MGTSLIVGHLPDESTVTFVSNFVKNAFVSAGVEQSLQSFLGRFLSKSPLDQKVNSLILEWKAGPAEVGYLDTLNEASVVAFLEFTAKLEGTSSEEAIENSKWKNLPYWLQSIWLPLEGVKVDPVVVEIEGMPTLIGTATGLVNDLEAIATAADIGLKKKPNNFDLMLTDPKAFYGLKVADLDEETTLRWIWHSYYAGAKLALLRNKPLWSGDDGLH
ncbi:MAG: hypothetical protein Q7T14_09910 [Aestuariivirga sp.]|nr:hypothetical protein [Aestuariivirga sp.]